MKGWADVQPTLALVVLTTTRCDGWGMCGGGGSIATACYAGPQVQFFMAELIDPTKKLASRLVCMRCMRALRRTQEPHPPILNKFWGM